MGGGSRALVLFHILPQVYIDQLQPAQWDAVNTKGHVAHDTTMLDLHHKLGRNTTHDSGYTHHGHMTSHPN